MIKDKLVKRCETLPLEARVLKKSQKTYLIQVDGSIILQ